MGRLTTQGLCLYSKTVTLGVIHSQSNNPILLLLGGVCEKHKTFQNNSTHRWSYRAITFSVLKSRGRPVSKALVDVFVTSKCIHLYILYCISLYPNGHVCSSDRESH